MVCIPLGSLPTSSVGTVGQISLGETALHSLGRIDFNSQTLGFLHRPPLITPLWDAFGS